mgnify:CR=1 FL=1
MKKNLFLIFFFLLLVLFQASFFYHFNLWGVTPNLVLIFLVLLNFFEKKSEKSGIFIAAFSGLLLDFFSGLSFGVYFLTFIFLAFLIKKILKSLGEENIVYFILVFLFSFFIYNLLPFLLNSLFSLSFIFHFNFGKTNFFALFYNLLSAIFFFFLTDYAKKYF